MKFGIIGAGSFGTTLAQLLVDNNHEVLLFDINVDFVNKINNEHLHPFFDKTLDEKITASSNLEEVVQFGEGILLAVPTKVMRTVLKNINKVIKSKKLFINVSKGIEPDTLSRVSEIVYQEIDNDKIEGYVCLTGPSHAEEIIERKFTCLVSASQNEEHAKLIQQVFSNNTYMRVYRTDDYIGAELNGSIKNAIAVVSGVAYGYGLLENARAALITRGCLELVEIALVLGSKRETAYGLTGLGDLIVTCSSFNSRNFKAGKLIGEGNPVSKVMEESKMVVEGIRAIEACYQVGKKYNLDLPIINIAYEVCYNNLPVKDAVEIILNREQKVE